MFTPDRVKTQALGTARLEAQQALSSQKEKQGSQLQTAGVKKQKVRGRRRSALIHSGGIGFQRGIASRMCVTVFGYDLA